MFAVNPSAVLVDMPCALHVLAVKYFWATRNYILISVMVAFRQKNELDFSKSRKQMPCETDSQKNIAKYWYHCSSVMPSHRSFTCIPCLLIVGS